MIPEYILKPTFSLLDMFDEAEDEGYDFEEAYEFDEVYDEFAPDEVLTQPVRRQGAVNAREHSIITNLEEALDPTFYEPWAPPAEEKRYQFTFAAGDVLDWSNQEPPTHGRRNGANIMGK